MNARELIDFFKIHSIELKIADGNIKCKAPKGFMTAELLAHLKNNKQEILACLASSGANQQTIARRPDGAAYEVSFAQQRLWFLDQLASGSAFYNMPTAVRLNGFLDESALTRALNEIVRRHEILRSTFTAVDGKPVAVIAPSLTLQLPVADLTDLPRGERNAKAQWLLQQDAQAPFNLTAGPLIRAGLIRLDSTEHIVFLNLHHIISDVWSLGIVVKEVAALYAAYAQGLPSPLPELPIQYADFTHWQRRWLSGDVLQKQI
ncbi:MAG TPA: condensation domain-containing protein, partial [Burkholderiaceae bacterium]